MTVIIIYIDSNYQQLYFYSDYLCFIELLKE